MMKTFIKLCMIILGGLLLISCVDPTTTYKSVPPHHVVVLDYQTIKYSPRYYTNRPNVTYYKHRYHYNNRYNRHNNRYRRR